MSASRRRSRGPSTLPDDPIVTRHQRFIRSLPCLRCGKPAPSECAYVGMLPELGIPASERYLLPLCGPATVWQDCCHSRKHYRGADRFWSELGIEPLDLAVQLWRVSGDAMAALRAVTLAWEAAPQRRSRGEANASSLRYRVNRGAPHRVRLTPTAMVAPPMSPKHRLLAESRS